MQSVSKKHRQGSVPQILKNTFDPHVEKLQVPTAKPTRTTNAFERENENIIKCFQSASLTTPVD